MSRLSLATKRDVILEIAHRSARLLVIAEACYFKRLCRSGRSMNERDVARSYQARDTALGYADSLADDVEALSELGLAGLAVDLLASVAREIRDARVAHCEAEKLDPRLVNLVSPACDEPPHKRSY